MTDAPTGSARRSGTSGRPEGAFDTLSLRGVGRSFGETAALADLDLEIRSGEFIALLGPSGCGKSTALNCLAGLLPLTHGGIWADDRRIDTLPPEKRGFGMVFQNYALFPHMSVRKNIAFGLQMRKLPRSEVAKRTDAAIELVRLGEHAGKLPGQLSGGQQQRVAIARAIVLEPALVLMDEPLSNLDAKLRLEMRTEIRRIHQSLGLTTVYVTHDQEEALSMADRLVVLRLGRVQQIGTPQELHTSPNTWHVADFMGYRNVLPAKADGVDGDTVTVSLGGTSVTGTARQPVSKGDAVVVGVRPEDIELGDADTGTGHSGLTGRVEVVEYQGRHSAADVRLDDNTLLHTSTERPVTAGDTVSVSVPAERLLVFASDEEAKALASGDVYSVDDAAAAAFGAGTAA